MAAYTKMAVLSKEPRLEKIAKKKKKFRSAALATLFFFFNLPHSLGVEVSQDGEADDAEGHDRDLKGVKEKEVKSPLQDRAATSWKADVVHPTVTKHSHVQA